MGRPIFEDKHPQFNGTSGYTITNEEPELFARMLGKRRFKRAAGIASGGEIPIQVLLPRSDEVLAIDHAYQPLAYSYMKTLMIESLGINKFQKLLLETSGKYYPELVKLGMELAAMLPEPLNKHLPITSVNSSFFAGMRKEWLVLRGLRKIDAKLDKLTLIHGDLTDLGQYGQVDCLYISNAIQHTNRTLKAPELADFAPLVVDGGILMGTGNELLSAALLGNAWKPLQNIMGTRTSWQHIIIEKLPMAATQAAV